ncbi:oxidoreductase, zinc-binding dehydrogenase family [Leptolyngbya sp. NIES-3755]|nr:oxidoreductase, zinc-binding dehydrogenase family [Leptolyngbya sp. NIES-3755]
MRAVWYEQVGAAKTVLSIGDLDLPELGSGQVRVKVFASGINPSDVKQRSG